VDNKRNNNRIHQHEWIQPLQGISTNHKTQPGHHLHLRNVDSTISNTTPNPRIPPIRRKKRERQERRHCNVYKKIIEHCEISRQPIHINSPNITARQLQN
jgi:hypothetical protein